jgi:Ca2+/Na+ antiporter
LLATPVAGWLLYRYGISPLSLILALLLLSCPLIVVWLSLSLARKTERDIALATRQELARRAQPEPGSKP